MSNAVRNLPKSRPEEMLVPNDILDELAAILSSKEFRGSQRCQTFLRYILEAFYRGDEDSLKERTLGIELFGRTPDYDTGADAIVRVTAHETRRRLSSYQLAHKDRSVAITMQPGTYVPTILRSTELQGVEPDEHALTSQPMASEMAKPQPMKQTWETTAPDRPVTEPTAPTAIPPKVSSSSASSTLTEPLAMKASKRWIAPLLWVVALSLLIMTGLTVRWSVLHTQDAVLRTFWGPVLSKKKTMLCTSKPNAYAFADLSATKGDANLALRIRDKLAAMGQTTRMVITSDLSENDLKEAPTVLIGNSGTNSWTARVANGFRFQFDTVKGNPVIRDVRNPDRIWEVPERPDVSHAALDYAVITRVQHSQFGPGLIAIAGSSSLSTHASGIALLDPESLNTMLKDAPNDWPQKNLQLVIRYSHIQTVDYAPQVVAAVYW